MDTPDGKVIRIVKVKVEPPPFETEVRIYEDTSVADESHEDQLKYARNVAEERFADALREREYGPFESVATWIVENKAV